MLFLLPIATVIVQTSTLDLKTLGREIDRKYDLDFLKDIFKFKVFVNPHPVCALEGEKCSLDNNCCRGMECKMAVGREGVTYTCQASVEEAGVYHDDEEEDEATNEDDIRWSIAEVSGEDSTEMTSNILQEIYRNRLEKAKKEEEKTLNDQYYLLKELQKPLKLEEMRELLQVKQVEDYKREQELKKLRAWAKKVEDEERKQTEKHKMLEKIAKERVTKVLKEEERQKLEMFQKVKEAMKQDMKTK